MTERELEQGGEDWAEVLTRLKAEVGQGSVGIKASLATLERVDL